MLFILIILPPPRSTLFPYTTLFRSHQGPLPGDPSHACWPQGPQASGRDRKSTRLNSSHSSISYAVFCLKKKIARHGIRRSEHVQLRGADVVDEVALAVHRDACVIAL